MVGPLWSPASKVIRTDEAVTAARAAADKTKHPSASQQGFLRSPEQRVSSDRPVRAREAYRQGRLGLARLVRQVLGGWTSWRRAIVVSDYDAIGSRERIRHRCGPSVTCSRDMDPSGMVTTGERPGESWVYMTMTGLIHMKLTHWVR